MINTNAVIIRIQQRNYPSGWRVYYGTGNYGCAITWLFGAVFLVGLGCPIWYGMNPALFLVLGIPCAVCLIGFFLSRSNANADKHSILAVLPEGVVQCYAGDLNRISWLYFPNIDRIELAQQTEISGVDGDISTNTNYWLDIYCRDGTYFDWHVRNCFGDAAFMCKTIIAAYNHYCNHYWRSRGL